MVVCGNSFCRQLIQYVLTSLKAGKARPGRGGDPTAAADPLFRPMSTHYAAAATLSSVKRVALEHKKLPFVARSPTKLAQESARPHNPPAGACCGVVLACTMQVSLWTGFSAVPWPFEVSSSTPSSEKTHCVPSTKTNWLIAVDSAYARAGCVCLLLAISRHWQHLSTM
jgi:hypothetical protein